jgi:exosortase
MKTAPATTTLLDRSPWKSWHLLAGSLLVTGGFLATFDAWLDIQQIALRDEEASHILLVPFVAIALAWVRRLRWRLVRPTHRWIGPAIVAVGGALHVLGDAQLIQAFWHGGAVLVVIGCALSILGWDVLKQFLPAFAVLLLLVPVPGMIRQEISLPLQTATAHVTAVACEMIGLPLVRSGNLLITDGVEINIAEACNGLRMVFALFLVSIAFAYTAPLRWYARLAVLALSPIAAIFFNVVRLVPTAWLYGNSSLEMADFFHEVSGWPMIFVAFACLVGLLRVLQWATVPVTRYPLAYD